MAKVFISHSSKNKKLVELFVEFLQLGMGVGKDDIFCTMFPEQLATGKEFMERIRTELQVCETVISVITEEYLQSKFCLIEMGAAWAMSKTFFPLVAVPYERLDETPLRGLQMRKLDKADDISTIYDELYECGVRGRHQTAQFTRMLPSFIERVKKVIEDDRAENMSVSEYMEGNDENEKILTKDEGGYYQTVITQKRAVRGDFRCYKIKGQIADPPDSDKASSDWLFYWKDVFPDLKVGDVVRFKTTKSKVNVFPDIGRARNLYPDDLERL